MMLQVKNKAAHAAPVPAEGQWLSEQGSHHHCPTWDSFGRPTDGGLGSEGPQPRLKPRLARGSTGEATPSEAVEKEIVPFNDLAPVTQT